MIKENGGGGGGASMLYLYRDCLDVSFGGCLGLLKEEERTYCWRRALISGLPSSFLKLAKTPARVAMARFHAVCLSISVCGGRYVTVAYLRRFCPRKRERSALLWRWYLL